MAISAARRAAFQILARVEEGGYASDLLHARLPAGMKPQDAALATELTMGVLRWQRTLDFLIEQQVGKPAARLDAAVRLALRMGLYQLRYLTRVPARAAVNDAVDLVKRARKRSAAALVNAVLRRAPTGPLEGLLPAGLEAAERLGILNSHPTWMVARWEERYGEPRTIQLLQANNRQPANAAILHTPKDTETDRVMEELAAAGVVTEPGKWLREALRIRSGRVHASPAFQRGVGSMQDEASQMVAHLVGVKSGDTVLDVCAAPGGKTITLARAAGRDGRVIAADAHVGRLRALGERVERAGLENVQLVACDATALLPLAGRFDCILVDAPCSGTGTLARNPEIRWRLRPEDLSDFARRQAGLLASALAHLAPGGRLVYATCSLEREENEDVVAQALAGEAGLRLLDFSDALQPHLRDAQATRKLVGTDGYFRTFPPEHETDGFFAAVLGRE